MRAVHIDATMGVAGDMLLAALLDAGADRAAVNRAVGAVLPGASITVAEVSRHGLRAALARVTPPGAATAEHRTWSDVRHLLLQADLSPAVRTGALAVFELLADAEGRVHGVDPEQVHFHEVGAWDSICDIVGVAAALESLSAGPVSSTAVGVGAGVTAGDHGILPVPPPAVVELFRAAGVPHQPGPAQFESCTPTGAALLCHYVTSWVAPSAWVTRALGVGAGSADPQSHANIVRALVGEPTALSAAGAVVLETNVDDLDPRAWPGVQAELLAAGASDVWLTPILMKKGRPAVTLSVLTPEDARDLLAGAILRLTSAIGMRVLPVTKLAADRTEAEITVSGCPVRVKIASWQGAVVNVQPEWEDVAAAATATGLPAKQILALAHAAAAKWWG